MWYFSHGKIIFITQFLNSQIILLDSLNPKQTAKRNGIHKCVGRWVKNPSLVKNTWVRLVNHITWVLFRVSTSGNFLGMSHGTDGLRACSPWLFLCPVIIRDFCSIVDALSFGRRTRQLFFKIKKLYINSSFSISCGFPTTSDDMVS